MYRNCFNKLCYTTQNDAGMAFEVVCNDNKIVRVLPYLRTDASISYGHKFFDTVPPFDSFIKAVAYLKENKNKMF